MSSGTLHPTIPYHTCPHVILETIADICFLSGIYIDWGKFSDEFGCQDHRSRSRSFFGRFKVTWYCYERSEISSPTALFFLVFDAVVYTNYEICTTHWITTGKHLLTLLTTSARNQEPRPTQPEPAVCVGWNEYLAKAGVANRHIA